MGSDFDVAAVGRHNTPESMDLGLLPVRTPVEQRPLTQPQIFRQAPLKQNQT